LTEDATLPAPGAADDATRLAPEDLAARLPYDAPARIGPYHLIRRIGEGGMGEVWEAEQREPIFRRVAIKLVKVGMDTHHFVARFEAERQALALMEHPAIARIIDGGATETGRPYLVMEFVEGQPITRYCDQRRLSTRQRLELFMQVCDGVEHAHRRGILHRDLKPSNVLVAERDGETAPKIIDFGVAKAIAEPLTERTLHTMLGGWIGTPAYMSPEQADIRGDIDTRTDVYSLGVMLYEILTGVRPLPEETIDSAAPDELRRIIHEREAPRPSARFSSLGTESTAYAHARSTDSFELARRLRGDLDWIVLKAIEKDRDRRYGSPSQLAEDIRRHLQSEPVVARPPSAIYRAGRFVRRHKLIVAAGAVALTGLVAAVVGTGIGLVRARAAEAQARRAASTAERVTQFLVDLFTETDPSNTRGEAVTVREVLDRGADRVRDELASEPVVQARLEQTIGDVYDALGLYDRAEPLHRSAFETLERELGADDPSTESASSALASALWRLGRYDEAEPVLRRVLEARRARLGNEHQDTIKSQNDLANLLLRRGDFAGAESLYRDAWETNRRIHGPEHPLTLGARHNLAIAIGSQGRHDEEIAHLEAVLDARRRTQGADHPNTLGAAMNLATTYQDIDRLEEAQTLADETYEGFRRVLGEDHPDTLSMLGNLGGLDMEFGRWDAAIDRYTRVVETRVRVLGADHDQTLIGRRNLAYALHGGGRSEEAEAQLLIAVAGLDRSLGPDAFMTLDTRAQLAILHAALGRNLEAMRELESLLPGLESALGARHPDNLDTLFNLACIATRVGEHEKALGYLERSLGGKHDPDILTDPDLEPLRGEPRFQALAKQVSRPAEGQREL
jgi:non-specific serine/threonine protein kinase/serine/threonine-protein kinase